MKNPGLAALNFTQLLDYGGQPEVKNSYPEPLPCRSYCVDCEEKGLLAGTGRRLDKMSHGCDTSDFEALLGPLTEVCGELDSRPVMFLLEGPGGDNGVFAEVAFRGYCKRPPVNHYYWTPETKVWPTTVEELGTNFYGPYFAYLMRRHRLGNVYITNFTKCDWVDQRSRKRGAATDPKVLHNCAERWLHKEVDLFKREVVFCFGQATEGRAKTTGFIEGSMVVGLYHPSAILLARRQHKTIQEVVGQNDAKIEGALARRGA